MKKFLILISILFCMAIGIDYFAPSSSPLIFSAITHFLQNEVRETPGENKLIASTHPAKSSEGRAADGDRVTSSVAHPAGSDVESRMRGVVPIVDPGPQASGAVTATPTSSKKGSDESTPSIGTVRVLGHRGCDANTQGWFLSVGSPEQYDFTVSDDGETVVVEPNTPELTGNFEFIHCANPGQFTGQHVRFSATIKAQAVTQTAQLRLRGEDLHREVIVGPITKVTGTYDWKDFVVEAEVVPEVVQFSYGLTFRSSGKIWLSHPRFEILP